MRWERVQVNPVYGHEEAARGVGEISGPGKRWGHTCNAIKGGRFLYLFGGYGKDNCQTNQVHVFDTVKQTWSQPVIKGTPPTPRDSHSCTTVGDNLVVFGGTDGISPLKDLHILDTSSHTWISPRIRGEGPEAREGHSAAFVGKRLFIFGGSGKNLATNKEKNFNDLYILNTETFVWKCVTTTGTPPSPRDSHTCSAWKNNFIVIAGEDKHDYYLSDVHILDTDTLVWRELNTSGQLLPPRAGHATVALGKNMFVFGGFTDAQNLYNDLYILNVDGGVWTKVATLGEGPCPRFSVAGDCLDPCKSGVLVFMGGCSNSLEALDDMYYLHTGLGREGEQRLEKLSLKKQLKLKCQEQNQNSKALVAFSADIIQPMNFSCNSQPIAGRQNMQLNQHLPPSGKKAFQAKVTESITHGYTIETVIDGKPFKGVLFSNKPNSYHPDIVGSSRKRAAGETGDAILNGVYSSKLKTPKVLNPDGAQDRQVDSVDVKVSLSLGPQTEAAAAIISNIPTTSDPSQPHKESTNPEPLLLSLNQENDQKLDVPDSISEKPRDDMKNSVPSSTNSDVLGDDRSIDAQNHNSEAPKPAAAKDSSQNQGQLFD
ncbi:Kelch domain-containing protein 3 [Quillaja saponaria]|uniref:Kelch domain-containing protein 3 n=1 Tax=Quillaja saponaria TaxID=32244 RepID=A0AAD7QCG0_QUISA|nr:Kelch domain-containing protein 3 [Quillaja saponaria]